jgi:hypothetical protein
MYLVSGPQHQHLKELVMAKHQCPNCGGYKTYSWKSNWRFDLLQAGGLGGGICIFLVAMGGALAAAIPVVILGCFMLMKLYEWVTGPAKSHVCEICNCNFDPRDAAPTGTIKPNLIEMGNALLQRQRAAAGAAEEERYQEEQRRRYAGT